MFKRLLNWHLNMEIKRVYVKSDEVPKVLNGLGIAIIPTSKGIMTDKEARKQNLGGEVLAYIW